MDDSFAVKVPGRDSTLSPKPISLDQIESSVSNMLRTLAPSGKADTMSNSLERISQVYQDMISSPLSEVQIPWQCAANIDADGQPFVDELIVVSGCHFVSLREHDLTPNLGVAHFAYLPDRRITDHADVKRAISFLARKPQRHEHLLKRLLDAIEQSVLPRGLGLVLHSVQVSIGENTRPSGQEVVSLHGLRGELKRDPWRTDFLQSAAISRPRFGL